MGLVCYINYKTEMKNLVAEYLYMYFLPQVNILLLLTVTLDIVTAEPKYNHTLAK
jgi:hypothetical protein